jgi:adenosine deaminase
VAAGVPVTLATDDPGMFHTDLDAEYRLWHEVFGLGIPELAGIAGPERGRRSVRTGCVVTAAA